MILEQNELILSRRSFLGWTAKIGIIAVTTKLIPASLDDLEVIKCNITASDIVRLEKVYVNEHMIRAELWSKTLIEALLDQFGELYNEKERLS